ncbi:MAG: ABC transporter substrate-binding protein [Desulfuromusa sp.]|nr:ABC transporter substrate-binding protein [Desulfuromusa sp.]
MKRSMWIKSCLVLFFGFFAIGNGVAGAAEKLVLQLPWHHQFQFAGYYMAKEKGYYQDAGLEVEIRDITQGESSVEEVLSGRADLGVSGSGLLVERSLGKPIVAVAAIFQQSPTVLLSLEQSDIRKPVDLIGKKVMLSPGFNSLSLIALLHQEGVLDKVERIETNFDYHSLLNGQTDVFNAYRTNEPHLLETQGYQTNIINPEDYGINFYGDILFTSEGFLQNNHKLVEKFRTASLKGWDYALKHPDETIAVIQSKYHSTKTVQQLQVEAVAVEKVIQSDQVEIGTLDRARWAQIGYHLKVIGQVSPSFKWSDSFLYEPPQGIRWQEIRLWIVVVLAAFTILIIFLTIASKGYFHLRAVRKQLQEEIEERKQIETVLSLERDNLNSIFAAMDDGVYIVDENFDIQYVNPVLTREFGTDTEKKCYEYFHDRTEVCPWCKNERILKGETVHWEWYSSKAEKTYDLIDTPLQQPDGSVLKLEIFRDITERKQLEDERSQLLQAIDQSSETIVITDSSGTIQYANPAFEKISGYTREEAIGQNPHILKSDQQDDAFYSELWKTLTGGEVWKGRFINKKKDGTLYTEDATISPVHNVLGEVVNYIAVKRDITHVVEIEEQLRQKYKMEAVGVMAGGMAHNFNNNLAIILGNIELSQLKLAPESEAAPLLKNAKIAVLRSRDLIQQILTYSRKGAYNKTSIQLSEVMDETLKLLQLTIPSTINVRQTVSMSSRDVAIHGDSSQIQEILINLYNNAVYAMDEEGDLTISIDMVDLEQKDIPAQYQCLPGCYAKLSVQDSGCGMSTEIIGKIFDLFFTTKEVDEGTGVGLSTVQGIVDQHDGLIKVVSSLGEGTTFELFFPIIERRQKERIPVVQELPKGTEKILFLDDDEMIANVWSEMLREYGYRVSIMTDSSEALKLFTANPDYFDLVITDQTIPGLSGKELIQKLLKIRPDLATVLCTGYSSKINESEAKELGIDAFCMKPLDLSELLQTVRQVLEGGEDSG